MGYLLNPISPSHTVSALGSIRDDENLYTRSIVPIDLHRPSLEADELFASGLPARVDDALRPYVARVLIEVLAQDVRPHVAPDCRKEVGGGAAPRRRLPAVDERDERMDDGGDGPRLQLSRQSAARGTSIGRCTSRSSPCPPKCYLPPFSARSGVPKYALSKYSRLTLPWIVLHPLSLSPAVSCLTIL